MCDVGFFNLYTLNKETKYFIETKHFSATNYPYFKLWDH